ncbi:MAG: ABC transporter ATP-binding protein [Firmicutes bacterium]|nr:ABC transporter ATP-binding protein [Bacillota bacterium]
MIKIKNITKIYNVGNQEISALNDISFEANAGEFVVVVGPSGSGKTTLLNLLGGMDVPTSGDIFVDDKNIAKYNARQLTEYRRYDASFVFQFYNLMPNLTALENVELAVEICKVPLDPKEVLEEVGLKDRLNSFPTQLSGGEQQRVSIARSIAKNSTLILCDEPTGALDYETGKKILKLLYNASKQHNKTVILVTHNSALKDMADKVVFMKNGQAESIITNKTPKPIEKVNW